MFPGPHSILLVAVLATGNTAVEENAASSAPTNRPSVLIDADWLDNHRHDRQVQILELGPVVSAFREGHIPGAQFVHWIDDITEPTDRARYTVAPATQIQTLLRRLGTAQDAIIVLYDDLNSRVSARMFWTLRYYGHADVRILDGGKQAWRRSGRALVPSKGRQRRPSPGNYIITRDVPEHRIQLAELRQQLQRSDVMLLDGRPHKQYTGEEPGQVYHTGKSHEQRGHIPGAVNVLWKDNFNDDGTFKSPAELRVLYSTQGVKPDQLVITYCNEGLHAAPPWFVLTELLGYDRVRVYDESMAEWANDSTLPVREGNRP